MGLRELLAELVAEGATDIVFSAGSPPCVRIRGEFRGHGSKAMAPEALEKMLAAFLDEGQRKRFAEDQELDASVTVPGVGRFRLSAYRQRGAVSLALRNLRPGIPTLEALHLPPVVAELAGTREGLIAFTGGAGSGRSTTLAAFVDRINQTRGCHIVTLEEPIEFLHPSKKGLVEQRQVGTDTRSYQKALEHVARQAPDVVVVGDLPDLETIAAVLKLADTGRLVLTTLDTRSAAQTVDRLVEVFPGYQQQQVRARLSWVLRAVISQQLLPTADGREVRPACEVMVVNPAIVNLLREGKTHLLDKAIAEGASEGMVSMDDSLVALVEGGAVAPSALSRMAQPREGVRAAGAATGMEGPDLSPARGLEKQLYDGNPGVRRKAETALKELEAKGDPEAARILKQFGQFYITNFEDKKIGLKR